MAQHGIPFFSFIYLGTFTHGVCHSIIVPLPSSGSITIYMLLIITLWLTYMVVRYLKVKLEACVQ